MNSNEEIFGKEYYSKWEVQNYSYLRACWLWLWYHYHCELYDSKVCTGNNKYGDYMPASDLEYRSVRENSYKHLQFIQNKRLDFEKNGIIISEWDWQLAKKHYSRYKLKTLEEEYKFWNVNMGAIFEDKVRLK